MTWDELKKKHAEQWNMFFSSSKKSMEELDEKHCELEETFFDLQEEIPLKLKERMRIEWEDWRSEWDAPDGKKIEELKANQQKERIDLLKVKRFEEYLEELNNKEQENRALEKEV